jgi:hypothetical protein
MNRREQVSCEPGEVVAERPSQKRPYHKPAFRCERVFETMALTCGKVSPTQGACQSNNKNS